MFSLRLMEEAHICDLWRKKFRRPHPSGGTGSLFVQATLYPMRKGDGGDADYCAALGAVLTGLELWRRRVDKAM